MTSAEESYSSIEEVVLPFGSVEAIESEQTESLLNRVVTTRDVWGYMKWLDVSDYWKVHSAWWKIRDLIDFSEIEPDPREPSNRPVNLYTELDVENLRLSEVIDPAHRPDARGHGVVTLRSLRDSIATGKIRAITELNEGHLAGLAGFLKYSGVPTDIGTDPVPSSPLRDRLLAGLKRDTEFFDAAFNELSGTKVDTKYWSGPNAKLFESIGAAVKARLDKVQPDLPSDTLHSEIYQERDTRRVLRRLTTSQYKLVEGLKHDRLRQLQEAGEHIHAHDDGQQKIPEGLLDGGDSFLWQLSQRGCANTAFRMAFLAITGDRLSEDLLQEKIKQHHNSKFAHDEDYLKIFQTEAFKSRYPWLVQSRVFAGMDLSTIAKAADNVRRRSSAAKVLTVLSLQTDTSTDYSIQHRVLLLGADAESVTVHDSNQHTGSAFRKLPKDVFYKRWAIAQNAGYLVAARPMPKAI